MNPVSISSLKRMPICLHELLPLIKRHGDLIQAVPANYRNQQPLTHPCVNHLAAELSQRFDLIPGNAKDSITMCESNPFGGPSRSHFSHLKAVVGFRHRKA